MSQKTTRTRTEKAGKPRTRAEELLDELIKECDNPEEIIGENGLLKQLTKGLLERAMQGELTHHLGYEKHDPTGNKSGNSRNGSSQKTIKGEFGELLIDVPRDRNGTYEPQIIQKGQTRFAGFDEKIISMYARGLTTREIKAHLEEIYGVEVSADLVSQVTDSVMEEVREWQSRPLDSIYPIVFLDAIFIKIRDGGHVKNKAVYLAIGVNMDGLKETLGIWVQQTEGAKFWLQIVTELKNRGVNDILIACVDGLKGFPEAINSVFPETEVQLCIVHMMRNSLKYVSYKDRRVLARDLKKVYHAANAEQAEARLEEFAKEWDDRYPTISKMWRNNWELLIPFMAYPEYIRRAIYTTNAIESMNMSLRKVTKNRGSFPNDEAAVKLLYLALRNISKKWTMPIREWGKAMNQFAIAYEGRLQLV
jgi:transposase-like protein